MEEKDEGQKIPKIEAITVGNVAPPSVKAEPSSNQPHGR